MEECTLTIRIFDTEIDLDKRSFDEMPDLLQKDDLRKRLSMRFTDVETRILNCMLYFVVYVSNRLSHASFEQLVRRKISCLYVENKMRIRMYDCSYTISRATGLVITECIHIIYYLMYGRFASAAYVNIISQNRDQQRRGNKSLQWKKSISNYIETPTPLISPNVEKKFSWNFPTNDDDLDLFSQELESSLSVKPQNTRQEKQQFEDHRDYSQIEKNSLGIKLRRIKNRQTSPLMNIFCNQTHSDFNNLRVNRRILDCTEASMSKTFMSSSKKDRLPLAFAEKQTKQKISIKSVINMRQKLKSDNVFLDELRKSLMAHSSMNSLRKKHQPEYQFQSKLYHEKETQRQPLANIQNKLPVANEESKRLTIDSPKQLKINEQQKKQEAVNVVSDNYVSESNPNDPCKILTQLKKPSTRIKLTFYKQKYKEFLRNQESRSQLLM